jgi:hypothetical protein
VLLCYCLRLCSRIGFHFLRVCVCVTGSGYGKKSETYENTSVPPTVRELQVLKKLRFDIVTQCASVSPEGCPGAAVQTLTQKLLDLDNPAGRATV